MVRFIIFNKSFFVTFFAIIYIPIWLDLLCQAYRQAHQKAQNLHSNMVRFIIASFNFVKTFATIFTFQYG